MNPLIAITDLQDPRLAVFTQYTEAELRALGRSGEALCIVESSKAIHAALAAGYRPISYLMEEKHVQGKGAALLAQSPEAAVYVAPSSVLTALTGFPLTRGILCAMQRPKPRTPEGVYGTAKRLALLVGIADPSNLGAIVRSAAALSLDGLLLDHTCADPLSRKAIRVSMGAVFRLPWAIVQREAWQSSGLSGLHAAGFQSVALTLAPTAVSLRDFCVQKRDKVVLLLGNEGSGLPEGVVQDCHMSCYIPMAPGMDSLNVAAAAAIAFWHFGEANPAGAENV